MPLRDLRCTKCQYVHKDVYFFKDTELDLICLHKGCDSRKFEWLPPRVNFKIKE